MIRRVLQHATAGLPLTTHCIPWWGMAIPLSLGAAAYVCRQVLMYKLASKALDKAPAVQMAAVMTAVTGQCRPVPAAKTRT